MASSSWFSGGAGAAGAAGAAGGRRCCWHHHAGVLRRRSSSPLEPIYPEGSYSTLILRTTYTTSNKIATRRSTTTVAPLWTPRKKTRSGESTQLSYSSNPHQQELSSSSQHVMMVRTLIDDEDEDLEEDCGTAVDAYRHQPQRPYGQGAEDLMTTLMLSHVLKPSDESSGGHLNYHGGGQRPFLRHRLSSSSSQQVLVEDPSLSSENAAESDTNEVIGLDPRCGTTKVPASGESFVELDNSGVTFDTNVSLFNSDMSISNKIAAAIPTQPVEEKELKRSASSQLAVMSTMKSPSPHRDAVRHDRRRVGRHMQKQNEQHDQDRHRRSRVHLRMRQMQQQRQEEGREQRLLESLYRQGNWYYDEYYDDVATTKTRAAADSVAGKSAELLPRASLYRQQQQSVYHDGYYPVSTAKQRQQQQHRAEWTAGRGSGVAVDCRHVVDPTRATIKRQPNAYYDGMYNPAISKEPRKQRQEGRGMVNGIAVKSTDRRVGVMTMIEKDLSYWINERRDWRNALRVFDGVDNINNDSTMNNIIIDGSITRSLFFMLTDNKQPVEAYRILQSYNDMLIAEEKKKKGWHRRYHGRHGKRCQQNDDLNKQDDNYDSDTHCNNNNISHHGRSQILLEHPYCVDMYWKMCESIADLNNRQYDFGYQQSMIRTIAQQLKVLSSWKSTDLEHDEPSDNSSSIKKNKNGNTIIIEEQQDRLRSCLPVLISSLLKQKSSEIGCLARPIYQYMMDLYDNINNNNNDVDNNDVDNVIVSKSKNKKRKQKHYIGFIPAGYFEHLLAMCKFYRRDDIPYVDVIRRSIEQYTIHKTRNKPPFPPNVICVLDQQYPFYDKNFNNNCHYNNMNNHKYNNNNNGKQHNDADYYYEALNYNDQHNGYQMNHDDQRLQDSYNMLQSIHELQRETETRRRMKLQEQQQQRLWREQQQQQQKKNNDDDDNDDYDDDNLVGNMNHDNNDGRYDHRYDCNIDMAILESLGYAALKVDSRTSSLDQDMNMLIWDVIDMLPSFGQHNQQVPTEAIYESTILTFCKNPSTFPYAINVLTEMEQYGNYKPSTAFIRNISMYFRERTWKIDKARRALSEEWERLQKLQGEGEELDDAVNSSSSSSSSLSLDNISARPWLNSVLSACAERGDMRRALDIYYNDFVKYDIRPNGDTYAFLLESLGKRLKYTNRKTQFRKHPRLPTTQAQAQREQQQQQDEYTSNLDEEERNALMITTKSFDHMVYYQSSTDDDDDHNYNDNEDSEYEVTKSFVMAKIDEILTSMEDVEQQRRRQQQHKKQQQKANDDDEDDNHDIFVEEEEEDYKNRDDIVRNYVEFLCLTNNISTATDVVYDRLNADLYVNNKTIYRVAICNCYIGNYNIAWDLSQYTSEPLQFLHDNIRRIQQQQQEQEEEMNSSNNNNNSNSIGIEEQ